MFYNIPRVEMGIGKVHFPLRVGGMTDGGGRWELVGAQENSIASQCFI